jgi:hypothetical protein
MNTFRNNNQKWRTTDELTTPASNYNPVIETPRIPAWIYQHGTKLRHDYSNSTPDGVNCVKQEIRNEIDTVNSVTAGGSHGN